MKQRVEITGLLLDKYDGLKERIRAFGRVAVAFSAGVDSTFLLYAAKEALGDNVIALTVRSRAFPKSEYEDAVGFCKKNGIDHITIEIDELAIDGFADNPKNRCYYCKRAIFGKMLEAAASKGVERVIEGSNADDEGDYRPGLAAIKELGIISPLRELGFTKAEIRALSGKFGLPTAEKPSMACLASRFPYGERITAEKLLAVGKAEDYLRSLGFTQVRVRVHGDVARIEVLPEQTDGFFDADLRKHVDKKLKELGFTYVCVDLGGYETGNMNKNILKELL